MNDLSRSLWCFNPRTGKSDGSFCVWEGGGKCLQCQAADEIERLTLKLDAAHIQIAANEGDLDELQSRLGDAETLLQQMRVPLDCGIGIESRSALHDGVVTFLDGSAPDEEEQRPSTEDYEYVVHHAELGWGHLARAVRALFEIAEGEAVEPARHARLALFDLPTCGVYESAAPEESGPLMSYKEAYEALAKSVQESHDWMTRDVVPQLKKHGIHIEGLTDRASEEHGRCMHPVHDNPGLIVPCPECGAGADEGIAQDLSEQCQHSQYAWHGPIDDLRCSNCGTKLRGAPAQTRQRP